MASSADWSLLYDRFYRKHELYSLPWEASLDQYVVEGCPYGGPVAMVRNENKVVSMKGMLAPLLYIYTSAGRELATIKWDRTQRLVRMGWTLDETLVCVLEDGRVEMYDVRGRRQARSFNLFSFKPLADDRVEMCTLWGNGVAALTRELELLVVRDLSSPKVRQYPMPDLTLGPPRSMAVIPPEFTASADVEVLLATPDNSIQVVSSEDCEDQLLQAKLGAPITRMAVHPQGKIVACFTADGILTVLSTDFTKKILDFNTKSAVRPLQLVWCGEDSVVLHWKSMLLMVGPYGDWVRYLYEENLHLVPEIDSVRIITDARCELLQRVPDCTVDIFKIGSVAPAAMLYDAMEAFESGSPKADESIRSILEDGKLEEAVMAAIDAAQAEFDVTKQRALLRAASYGKGFLEEFDSDHFVDTCKKLRVLNNVRNFKVGLPLTSQQYEALTPEVVLDRLMHRNQHLLALRVCDYLLIKRDRVLVHWACAKVEAADDSLSDEAIRDLIRSKLAATSGISYADIAGVAHQRGRRKLATLLLDFEPRAADQVPLLISMGEEEVALQKALASADTDLIYLVVLHMKRALDEADLFRVLKNYPAACNLLIAYLRRSPRAEEQRQLKTFLFNLERFLSAGSLSAREAYGARDLEERLGLLAIAHEMFSMGDKRYAFQMKATEEQIKLLRLQEELEERTGEECFVDMSLSETIFNCIVMGQHRFAERVRSDFRISDARFWHIKIRALAQSGAWAELEAFSRDRKSPVGYKPFADACIRGDMPGEAAKYVTRISDATVRCRYLGRIGYWSEAADVAAKQRDPELLSYVRNNCRNSAVERKVDEIAARLGFTS